MIAPCRIAWGAAGLAAAVAGCGHPDCVTRDELERGMQLTADRLTIGSLEQSLQAKAEKDELLRRLVEQAVTADTLSKRIAAVLGSAERGDALFETLRAIQKAIDITAGNLANVNTTAYKTVGVSFENGGREVALRRDFSQGQFDVTHRSLEWAIDGEGFFCLDRHGTQVYTRAGSFYRDREGNIVTAGGCRLDPPITIPENITDITIQTDGRVFGLDPGAVQSQQELGRIQITRFANPNGLTAIGDNFYAVEGSAAGAAVEGRPDDPGFGLIRDRTLEQSNVDILHEYMTCVCLQHWFEAVSKAIGDLYKPPDGK